MSLNAASRLRTTVRASLITITLGASFGCAPITPTSGAAAPHRASARVLLCHTIDSLVSQPMFRTAEWGVLVIDPESRDTLYAHNAATLMVPASNMKIVTSAVALTQLGPAFTFSTTYAANGPVRGGVLHGDLVVTGRGDPTLSDHMRGSAEAAMGEIADSVVAHGIRSITGHIYSGADNFPGPPVGAGWDWDDLSHSYAAGVDELMFNEGMSRVVVHDPTGDSSVVVAPAKNPTRDYLTTLQGALAARGVHAALGVGDDVAPPGSVPLDTLFVIRSVPLRDILPSFLKPSQNQIGEALLRAIGLERTGIGTADSGIVMVSRQLAEWGVPHDGYVLRDGSGLARADLLSPQTIVRVLEVMQHDTEFSAYYAALPIAGVDGTLAHRMRGTAAAGKVHAKTGSMSWVRSLSGYVTDATGRRLIFSALCNKWTTSPESVTRTADAIAAAIASYGH